MGADSAEDDVTRWRSVIEGSPVPLGPELSIVPVVGVAESSLAENLGSILLEPLALIVAQPAGVTRLVLGELEDYAAATRPGTISDLMEASTRQQCVDALFGPPQGIGGFFRITIHRAAGEATWFAGECPSLGVIIRATELVGEIAVEDGTARLRTV